MVGEREHGVHVVLHQQHRVVLLQAQQQCHHLIRFCHAHTGQGFVEQQHLRIGRQRHGYFKLALFAMADGRGNGVAALCQACKFQRTFAACLRCGRTRGRAQPAQRVPGLLRVARLRRKEHVLPNREGQEDVGLLVAATQPLARDRLRAPAGGVLATQQHLARGGGQIAREQVREGGFTSAIGANHRMDAVAPQLH